MQNSIKTEESNKPVEKKTYVAPKLTRHGKVEDMTQLLQNPGPSNPLPN